MKESGFFVCLVLGFFVLVGASVLYAEKDFAEVDNQEEENYSDPSVFEGDSDAMPGERAPENLPMDDAPAVEGVAID